MSRSTAKTASAIGLLALGIALAAGSIYVAEIDDAPGAALFGFLLFIGLTTAAVKTYRKRH